MTKNNVNVLVLSAGRRVELINCFKAAKSELKISGKVYAADITTTAPALYFAEGYFILPRIGEKEYIEELTRICKENEISLVVPTIDTELEILALNKEKIEKESGAKVLISNSESVGICCDKIRTAEYFKAHGFGAPEYVMESRIKSGEYKFPLFIKPKDGSSSINAFKITDKKQLDFFLDYVKNPIVQECVSGKEYTVDCFSDFEGNIITIVPRIRLATRSGEVLKGKIDKNRTVISEVRKLIESLKFIGQITVQCFLCDSGEVKYIEINPRFGGGAPMSIQAGADSCRNLYKLLMGEKLKYNEDYEDGLTFSRFDSSVKVQSEN